MSHARGSGKNINNVMEAKFLKLCLNIFLSNELVRLLKFV